VRNELPWEKVQTRFQPQRRLRLCRTIRKAQPFSGLATFDACTQGCSCLATLGFEAEFLRNSIGECGSRQGANACPVPRGPRSIASISPNPSPLITLLNALFEFKTPLKRRFLLAQTLRSFEPERH
jgi:hypothetical protein